MQKNKIVRDIFDNSNSLNMTGMQNPSIERDFHFDVIDNKEFQLVPIKQNPTGVSAIVEPILPTNSQIDAQIVLPNQNINAFVESLNQDETKSSTELLSSDTKNDLTNTMTNDKIKKAFPYLLVAVALVGGYFIFRKK
jgi:hypothetical protein